MPEVTTVRDDGLGNSSYIVDLEDGRSIVIDPPRDPSPFLRHAERAGTRIIYAVETHLHADFVSGSRELAHTGARIVAPGPAHLEFPHVGLRDGDQLDLGGLTLTALATPGHTPEHLSYLLLDGNRPLLLFSGGALLNGSVARTDLIAPEQTEPLARSLWRSLRERILVLPDDVSVYPTHGTGATFCSATEGSYEVPTTIGKEKASNPLLAAQDEDEFVAQLLAGYGSFPRYFTRLREVNRRGPRIYGPDPLELAVLSVERVEELIAEGAEVIDARPIAEFAAGHIPGSVSNEYRSAFASWLGWLVDDDRSLVLVLPHDADRNQLVRASLKVGYEKLIGEISGGFEAWKASDRSIGRIPLIDAKDLHSASGTLVDVRQSEEFAEGHVAGAISIELGRLGSDSAPPAGRLALMCGHGQRAMTGASVLAKEGRSGVVVVGATPTEVTEALSPPIQTAS